MQDPAESDQNLDYCFANRPYFQIPIDSDQFRKTSTSGER